MNRAIKIIPVVLLLTIFGGFLRFFNNTSNPNSLNIDEVAYGYSAYSILKTGHDENGFFMPITFKSTGDYKNPLLIYSLVPSVAVFGLNEFSVRFTTGLVGTLTIMAFFLFTLSLTKNKKIVLISTAFLAISAWHIYYSRLASDHAIGLLLIILGMYFFQKMLSNGRLWAFLSAVMFILSMYAYHSQRLFVPMLLLFLLVIYRGQLKQRRSSVLIFISTCLILVLPLIHLSIFGAANSRAGMVFLSQDIDYTRYVILDHIHRPGEIFLLFLFWAKRYMNYFQPGFLFFNGLNMTNSGTLGLGVLYLYELPLLILGVIEMIKNKFENRVIIFSWILLGIFPASLTNNEQNSGRSLIILPMLIIVISYGLFRFFRVINLIKNRYLKIGVISGYILFAGVILIQAFLVFAVHFPLERGEAFMEGTKETILYAIKNKNSYREIVYDPYRGIEAPYIVNIPYMYYLFYSKYDPGTYQKERKYSGNEIFSFNKFTTRRIDWRTDKLQEGVLFIGSPWSLPQKDLKKEEILEKVYLLNGDLAFLIVSPKKSGSN